MSAPFTLKIKQGNMAIFDPEPIKQHELVIVDEYLFADNLFDTPEKNLLAMVLDRAIRDYTSIEHEVRREVETWFFCKENSKPFSFLWICEALDLDPQRIRTLLKKTNFTIKYRKISILNPVGSARKRVLHKKIRPDMSPPWWQ